MVVHNDGERIAAVETRASCLEAKLDDHIEENRKSFAETHAQLKVLADARAWAWGAMAAAGTMLGFYLKTMFGR